METTLYRISAFLLNHQKIELDTVSSQITRILPIILTKYCISFTLNLQELSISESKILQQFIDILSILLPDLCPKIQEIIIKVSKKFQPMNLSNLFDSFCKFHDISQIILEIPIENTIDSSKIFAPLSKCPHLRTYELPYYKINDKDTIQTTEALLHAGALENVAFNFDEMSEQTLSLILKELESHLKVKSITSCIPWKGEEPYNLIKYSKLEYLHVNLYYSFNSKLPESLSWNKSIKYLRIDQMKTKEIEFLLKVISTNQTIETLTIGVIREWEVYNYFADMLRLNKTLKFLKMHGASPLLFKPEVTPSQNNVFYALEVNTSLITLKCKGGAVDIFTVIGCMSKNNTLQSLQFKDVRMQSLISKVYIADLIRSCGKLRNFTLIDPELSGILVSKETGILHELFEVLKSKISEVVISKGLLDLSTTVIEISEENNGIAKHAIKNLATNNKILRKLTIRNIKIPSEHLKSFIYGIMGSEIIKEIRLENIGIDNDIANIIAEFIINNLSIRVLSIAKNPAIGLQGILAILSALKINKNILLLDLRGASLSTSDKAIIQMKRKFMQTPTKLLII